MFLAWPDIPELPTNRVSKVVFNKLFLQKKGKIGNPSITVCKQTRKNKLEKTSYPLQCIDDLRTQ